MPRQSVPADVAAINRAIAAFLDQTDQAGRIIGNAQYGVYVFYDYDSEPIYVGQTTERLRVRIRRHLTNQRTDAVAMNVLDPFEVAAIEVWPFYLEGRTRLEMQQLLAAAEYTVFQQVLQQSVLRAVLNEKDIPEAPQIQLPPSYRQQIVPGEILAHRRHPDIRIARRAATIAGLAKVISERNVSKGLRRTLVNQARRLHHLAERRLSEIGGSYPVEGAGENMEEDV
jgi:hypothetical protein